MDTNVIKKYLNKGKLDFLKKIDIDVLCLKNEMSQFVHNHILELNSESVLVFANKYYKQYSTRCNNGRNKF